MRPTPQLLLQRHVRREPRLWVPHLPLNAPDVQGRMPVGPVAEGYPQMLVAPLLALSADGDVEGNSWLVAYKGRACWPPLHTLLGIHK